MHAKEIVEKYGKTADNLIQILLDCQKTSDRSYLTEEDLKTIAQEMNLPESKVYSVATFYSLLSTKPRGKHVIQLCRDVPCYVNGSFSLKEELENMLQICMGETTKDGVFSLEYTSCLGYCEMAPVMRIGETIYGNLTSEKLSEIVAEYRRA